MNFGGVKLDLSEKLPPELRQAVPLNSENQLRTQNRVLSLIELQDVRIGSGDKLESQEVLDRHELFQHVD